MKPDWSDAPEWANYLVQDHEGDFIWFENKPDTDLGIWSADGRSLITRIPVNKWRDTLITRIPVNKWRDTLITRIPVNKWRDTLEERP